MKRRQFISAALPWGALPLSQLGACAKAPEITGGFTGVSVERGHLLRDTTVWPAPADVRTTRVVIAGGGVAGLAAARALRLRGMQDFALLELEDSAGGNARGSSLGGMACPLGAHYLPVPDEGAASRSAGAQAVTDLLEELGLRQRVAGRWQYDERHLCHSPQERLFFNGAWQDGLLPVHGVGAATLAQYRSFEALVEAARQAARWPMPVERSALTPWQRMLATVTFAQWLGEHGLDDPHLRWYLDYCCRDDFGAGAATVSAWAGLHYFASRHGFHAPGSDRAERDAVLTWPEGNAWFTRRLAAPLGERLHTGCLVVRIATGKQGVEVDSFNTATQSLTRWRAERAIVALPLQVAARVVENPPRWLTDAARQGVVAPWLVANIHIAAALNDRSGAAPSWDNVIYGDTQTAPGLGYVDAMHQSLRSVPGATVLTYYRALGDGPGGPQAGRRALLERPWEQWRDAVLAELSVPHPDLATKVKRIDVTRYGHAMAVPVPSASGRVGQTPQKMERLQFAHSDWAGYSVFEEAFAQGHAAGSAKA